MRDDIMSKKFVHLKSGRFKFSPNEIGTLGERIVEMLLRKEGFKVKHFFELLYRKEECSKTQALVEICRKNCKIGTMSCLKADSPNVWVGYLESSVWKSCRQYLSEYCPIVCKRFCKNRKILKILDEVGKKQRDERRGGLDFVAYKDEKIWVVEVKTGEHSELDASQKQLAERLRREMGIELLHFHVSLNDEIDYSVRCKSRLLPQGDFETSSP